jgi:hypothetical protein
VPRNPLPREVAVIIGGDRLEREEQVLTAFENAPPGRRKPLPAEGVALLALVFGPEVGLSAASDLHQHLELSRVVPLH